MKILKPIKSALTKKRDKKRKERLQRIEPILAKIPWGDSKEYKWGIRISKRSYEDLFLILLSLLISPIYWLLIFWLINYISNILAIILAFFFLLVSISTIIEQSNFRLKVKRKEKLQLRNVSSNTITSIIGRQVHPKT